MVRWESFRLRTLLKEMSKETSVLTKHAKNIFDKAWKASEDCYISGGTQASTTTVYTKPAGTEYVVNLRNKTCGCTLWQRLQIPCKHACEVFKRKHGVEKGKAEAALAAHLTWHTKEVQKCLKRGISDCPIPDWCIMHDLVENNGKLSDDGLRHILGASAG